MKVKGCIDSLSLRCDDFSQMFDSEDYRIVPVKSRGVFEPKLWRYTFKKRLTIGISEAKILYTSTGLTIALQRYSRRPTKQTLDIAGLQGYDDKSKYLNDFLKNHFLEFIECEIKRIDVCFDYVKVPSRIIKKLCESRKPFKYHNNTYYKTKSEKRTNATLDIKRYDKQKEAKLPRPMERLEFCFKGTYFPKGMKFKDLDREFFLKMEKCIKGFSGIDAKIISL